MGLPQTGGLRTNFNFALMDTATARLMWGGEAPDELKISPDGLAMSVTFNSVGTGGSYPFALTLQYEIDGNTIHRKAEFTPLFTYGSGWIYISGLQFMLLEHDEVMPWGVDLAIAFERPFGPLDSADLKITAELTFENSGDGYGYGPGDGYGGGEPMRLPITMQLELLADGPKTSLLFFRVDETGDSEAFRLECWFADDTFHMILPESGSQDGYGGYEESGYSFENVQIPRLLMTEVG
jgi:hypothetical protein